MAGLNLEKHMILGASMLKKKLLVRRSDLDNNKTTE